MIKINEKVIDINKFPDGTLLIKEDPSLYHRAMITWMFESNEELVALIYLTRHLKEHGVFKLFLFMPYVPNARQDRVKSDEDIFTLRHFAWVINSLKFDGVSVLDPHSSVVEALFNNIDVISTDDIINEVYSLVKPELMFYPDEGAMKRYSGMIQAPYAFGIKERNWETGQIKGLNVFDGGNEIRGKSVLIVDDICSRGGTFYHSAKKLKELGAGKIYLYVTHCEDTIFDGELLTSGLIERVYTTDSLIKKRHDKIEVIEL